MAFSWQAIRVAASAAVLPPRRVSNFALGCGGEAALDPTGEAERVLRQTGIRERRYALADEAASDLAVQALRALGDAAAPWTLGALIVATTSPDVPSPATAHFVHAALGLPASSLAFDVASSCSSFLSALHAAFGVAGGLAPGGRLALAATEVKHKALGNDPRMRALFADGAAVLVLERTATGSDAKNAAAAGEGFLPVYARVDAEFVEHIQIPVGGSRRPASEANLADFRLRINEPRLVFRHTVKAFCDAILACWEARAEALARAGFDPETCPGLVFTHQANANILRDARERLPAEIAARLPVLMEDVGNMVCASLPVARTRVSALERLWRPEGFAPRLSDGVRVASAEGALFRWLTPGAETIAVHDRAGGFFLEALSQDTRDALHAAIAAGVHGGALAPLAPRIDAWVAAGGGFQTLGVLHGRGLPASTFAGGPS